MNQFIPTFSSSKSSRTFRNDQNAMKEFSLLNLDPAKAPLRCSSIEILHETVNRKSFNMNVSQIRTMLTKMVFIICLFATFQHLFLTVSLKLFTGSNKSLYTTMIFLTNLSIFAKHSINFWIIYYFNRLFKKRLNHIVKTSFNIKLSCVRSKILNQDFFFISCVFNNTLIFYSKINIFCIYLILIIFFDFCSIHVKITFITKNKLAFN